MNRLTLLVAGAGLVGLVAGARPIAVGAQPLPKDVEQYLAGVAQFSASEIALLETDSHCQGDTGRSRG